MKDPAAGGGDSLLAPELMARVRQIQIRTRQMVSGALQGAYRSSFRGTGIEFEEVRPYLPGDEVRSIDWNVTARTGEPHIKTYVEERQLILQLVVDTGRSMDFGSGDKTKRDAAAEVCALLAFVAAASQDQVGLSLFADEPGLHLTPETGHHHVLRLVREVMAAPSGGTGGGLGEALERELRLLKRRSVVLVLSDFLDRGRGGAGVSVNGPQSDALARLARRHDVILARVVDPFEEQLPAAGTLLMQPLEGGAPLEVDTRSASVRRAWAQAASTRRAELLGLASRARVDSIEIATNADVADPIVRLFQRRAMGGGRR